MFEIEAPTLVELFGLESPTGDMRYPTQAETLDYWRRNRDYMKSIAVAQHGVGHSWRGANHGCAILYCCRGTSERTQFKIRGGANFTLKARPTYRLKLCCERVTHLYAEQGDVPVAIALYAEYLRRDDTSGLYRDTPFVCTECVDEVFEPVMPAWAPLLGFRPRGLLACDEIRGKGPYVEDEQPFGQLVAQHRNKTGRR